MYKWVSDAICVGLELEYEGIGYEGVALRYQEKYPKRLLLFKQDGSLRPRRHNTEITFAGPLSGALISEALTQIADVISWKPHRLSWRCGMHVHVDCRGMELARPYRAAILATLIEPVLFTWDGGGRQENKFCQSIVDSVYAYLPRQTRLGGGSPTFTKYSLLNLRSLSHLGTLELRFAASTKDMQRAADFINIGMGLREAVTDFGSGESVLESVLGAKDIASWIENNTHPLLAEQLAPVARRMGFVEPTVPAMNAALALAEYEQKLKPVIIGGQ